MLLLNGMNNTASVFWIIAILITVTNGYAQISIPEKVSHAEPLFYDLVRDLGARRGEKEFNLGMEFTNTKNYNRQGVLVEYEFAPINRLGFEVETDFTFFRRTEPDAEVPNNKLESLRLSTQYSFFVSPKYKTTLAIGYSHIVELTDFNLYGKEKLVTGNAFNPFFVAAKRWGETFHTLIYTNLLMEKGAFDVTVNWQINTSFFYTIPQTKHFIGVELNQEIIHGEFEMMIRPEVKVKLTHNLAIGFVTAFPVNNSTEGISTFFRIICEP